MVLVNTRLAAAPNVTMTPSQVLLIFVVPLIPIEFICTVFVVVPAVPRYTPQVPFAPMMLPPPDERPI